jgi:hypothetical protein
MAVERQYLVCSFRQGGRTYCYHHDHEGAPAAVGDRMKVDGLGGWQIVSVAAIVGAPTYPTKPVLGFADLKTQLKLSLERKE